MNGGTFTMTGGRIENNDADGSSGGGGVYLGMGGHFVMSGGTISGNTTSNPTLITDNQRAGVSMNVINQPNPPTFTMSGSARIAQNNEVFLHAGTMANPHRTIIVGGTFTGPASEIVAWIRPGTPSSGTTVLSGDFVGSSYQRFGLAPGITGFTIGSNGQLQ